ncbi:MULTISPECIES: aminopeptidase [Bacillus]|uniref:Aminopeptidase n=2 Tax=Bacillus cereus group TaxID=86661 RepID=A0A2A7DAF5_BACAN|nr:MULTISPECIES: aminopeptidase [Bacillus]MCP1164039.1 aminopeptidase [Bacillus sp. 1813sda1]OTW71765.1 aminopeptidase [Bacillus thuringiensis serovar coreanensis]OTX55385.1 aminopeptidase [Bacillus thuringiensis serovar sooncheon]OTX58722.1 aminopeptidase [Bacillus thuringiensis serovar guiyangiensis]OTX72646.1 aminopeptidase [Bacillus thuringiensis serovar roskildiensis]
MINNTIPSFLKLWGSDDVELEVLNQYFISHPEVFEEYFKYHCPKTKERLSSAIKQYSAKLEDIHIIAETLPSIIQEITNEYHNKYNFDVNMKFHLFVGGFGSNAFVEREIIGDIFFAAEKLSPDVNHLRVIVAHEIGHIYHNVKLQNDGIDWSKAEWADATVSLYREGVATYLSKQIMKGLNESVYYSYNDDGEHWLQCYIENEEHIKKRFLEDYIEGWTLEKEKEWFWLSGGQYFGYNRLGYFLGTAYLEYVVQALGESEAFTFWNKHDLKSSVMDWLSR